MTKITCESNRDIKNLLHRIATGKIDLEEGWHSINNGIYFRFYYKERTGKDLFQIAIQKNKFDNEYLIDHTKTLLDRFLVDIMEYDVSGDWGKKTGEDLDIHRKGKQTIFYVREIEA